MYVPNVPKIRHKVGTKKGPHIVFSIVLEYEINLLKVCFLSVMDRNES